MFAVTVFALTQCEKYVIIRCLEKACVNKVLTKRLKTSIDSLNGQWYFEGNPGVFWDLGLQSRIGREMTSNG